MDNSHVSLDDLKEFSIDLTNLEDLNNNTNKMKNFSTNSESKCSISSGTSCSSRTSHTSNNDDCENSNINSESKYDERNSENNSKSDKSDHSSESCNNDSSSELESSVEEEKILAKINNFPVQVICMENCEDTFDNLIINEELSEKEWFSAFMQIIMILITYQKVFSFTHNDLHTNNVMFNKTDKKFLYYCYNNKYYKVPTYGRVFKIIDFGRAIYKFNNKIFCSDSFQAGEDAATQYNFEPYFNEKKPRLEPNYSFDLCRLACSIFDYIVEDIDEIKNIDKCDSVVKLIVEWCLDDNGLNVLYKNNGQERYPDFKLYKMIARYVHNHVPHKQLERKEFSHFQVELVPKNETIMNIDKIPSFYVK